MVFLGFKGMLADQQLHCKTTEEEVVNGGGGGGGGVLVAVLQPLSKDVEEEESESENMATEEREKEELRPYLDEGIITKILVKIHSAESLHNNLRYVCKPWSHIISHNPYIHLNFLLPSSKATCTIIQNRENRYEPSYTTCLLNMGIREGGHLKVEQQVDLTPIFKKLCILDCCNGLVLATPGPNFKTLCIVNPRTNHRLVLPPRSFNADSVLAATRFTFLPSTGKYKVVTMERVGLDVPGPYFIQILTMSSSSPPAAAADDGHCSPDGDEFYPCPRWRRIQAPSRLNHVPLAINGVYYWPQRHGREHYITSFDVASERFYRTPHQLYSSVEACYGIMDNGFMDFEGYLAFWSFRPTDGAGAEADRRTFNVHVIEDLHEKGGEWKELYSGVRMDLDFIQASLVMPCMSFGNGEVMIFRNSLGGTLWAYHFKSQRWLKMGNNLKEVEFLNFWGYIVRSSSTPVPFDSLFSMKQNTTTTKKCLGGRSRQLLLAHVFEMLSK